MGLVNCPEAVYYTTTPCVSISRLAPLPTGSHIHHGIPKKIRIQKPGHQAPACSKAQKTTFKIHRSSIFRIPRLVTALTSNSTHSSTSSHNIQSQRYPYPFQKKKERTGLEKPPLRKRFANAPKIQSPSIITPHPLFSPQYPSPPLESSIPLPIPKHGPHIIMIAMPTAPRPLREPGDRDLRDYKLGDEVMHGGSGVEAVGPEVFIAWDAAGGVEEGCVCGAGRGEAG